MADKLKTCFDTLHDAGAPRALATVVQAVSPTSARPGDKALIGENGVIEGWIGGGCAQPAVISATSDALRDGRARLIRVAPKGEWEPIEGMADFKSGCLSGGTLVIFVEPLQGQTQLAIFGSSPVAKHLSKLAVEVDFAVVVACPQADAADFAGNVQCRHDFSDAGGELIVIATQGRHDRAALKAALTTKARFIGMIASAKKSAGLKAALAKAGTPQSELARVHSPVGIDIGATTPVEIAVSVLAQLVQFRRAGTTSSTPAEPASSAVLTAAASSRGGCCHD